MISALLRVLSLLSSAGGLLKKVPLSVVGYAACFLIPAAFAGYLYLQNAWLDAELSKSQSQVQTLKDEMSRQSGKYVSAINERNHCVAELEKTQGVIEQVNSDKKRIETDFDALKQSLAESNDDDCMSLIRRAIND